MGKKFLTLNIGSANVQLAEYEVNGKGALTLTKYGMAALGAPLEGGNVETILTPALMDIMREKGIRPGKVALSISGQMVFPKFAAIPMLGGADKFEQSVLDEIKQNIPFPIDEMVCDSQVLGDTEAGDKSVMIVAAKVDQIEELASAVRAAGFTLELVDVAPIAMTNAIRSVYPDDGSCVIALDIGARTTSLVIVEGDKLYNRSIPVAGNVITKEIATALGCTTEEAEQLKLEKGYVSLGGVTEDEDEQADRVAKVCRAVMTRLNAEISRSINFYRSQQQGGTPVKLFLTGGTALMPQLDEFFAEALGVEVEFFSPLQSVTLGKGLDAEAAETDGAFLSSTLGLALHQAGLAQFGINLLPPSLVSERAEKARIPFLIVGGFALVGALLLVMLVYRHEAEVIRAQVAAVEGTVGRLSAFDKKVSAAEEACKAAVADAEKLRQLLAQRPRGVQRLNTVRGALLPGMWIDKWEGDRVTVRSWKDRVKSDGGKTPAEQVADKLKGMSAVDPASVKILDMSVVGKDGQVDQFTVELKFK